MINGLSNSFEELNGLNKLYIDEMERHRVKRPRKDANVRSYNELIKALG